MWPNNISIQPRSHTLPVWVSYPWVMALGRRLGGCYAPFIGPKNSISAPKKGSDNELSN